MSRFSNWRMTPRALFRLLLALLLALAYAYNSRAQEVGNVELPEVGELVQGEGGEAAEVATLAGPVRAALDSIRARNPDNAIDWIRAVVLLRRMGAHAEAEPFLEQALTVNLDQRSMVELHNAIGTAELVALSVDRNLPEARSFVLSVFEAVRSAKRDSRMLANAAAELSSDQDSVRRASFAKLVNAGAYAVPAIVQVLRNEPDRIDRSAIEAVVLRLGSDAEEPLLALLGAPEDAVQDLAASMLGRIGSKRASLHLVRPYFVGSDAVRQSATSYFQHVGSAPKERQTSAVALRARAQYHLRGIAPVPAGAEGMLEMWTWSAEEENIVPYVVDGNVAASVVAARFARDAYELDPTAEAAAMLLSTRLQVEQTLGGLDTMLPRGVGTAHQLAEMLGWEAIRTSLVDSLRHGYDAAAQGACELMAHHGQGRPAADWSALVRALQHPNRRVRFAAAKAIMALDPRASFSGSSVFLDVLIDIAGTTGTPNALIGMSRRDARDDLSGKLSGLGFSVTHTSDAHPLLELASQTSDVDVIFLSDSVSRPTARETIQRLRHHPHTKNTPIVLLARGNHEVQANRIAPIDPTRRTIVLPEFVSEPSLQEALETLEGLVRAVAVSPKQRLVQAGEALAWLSHLAQYNQTYAWYDLQRVEAAAVGATVHPELSRSAVSLLGYLGGVAAQRELVALAGNKAFRVDLRQGAANAFTEAVGRHGLLLTSAEVRQQYDRYNASEGEEVSVQELLAQVLDVIETQTHSEGGEETAF